MLSSYFSSWFVLSNRDRFRIIQKSEFTVQIKNESTASFDCGSYLDSKDSSHSPRQVMCVLTIWFQIQREHEKKVSSEPSVILVRRVGAIFAGNEDQAINSKFFKHSFTENPIHCYDWLTTSSHAVSSLLHAKTPHNSQTNESHMMDEPWRLILMVVVLLWCWLPNASLWNELEDEC